MSNTNNRISVISAEDTIDTVFAENGKMKRIGDMYEEIKYREGIFDGRVSKEDAIFDGLKKTIRKIKALKTLYNKPIKKGGGEKENYEKDIEKIDNIIEKLNYFRSEPAIISTFIQKESQYVNLFESGLGTTNIPKYTRENMLYGHAPIATNEKQDIRDEHATLVKTLKTQLENLVQEMKDHMKEHIEYLDEFSKDITELSELVSKYITNKNILNNFKKLSKEFFNEENDRLKILKLSTKTLYDNIHSASEILVKNETQKKKPQFSSRTRYYIYSSFMNNLMKDDTDNEFIVQKNSEGKYTLKDYSRYVFKENNDSNGETYYTLQSNVVGGFMEKYFTKPVSEIIGSNENLKHIDNLKDYLEIILKKNIERSIQRNENGEILEDDVTDQNINPDIPTSNNVDDIFETLMKSHEEKRSKARTLQQRLGIDMEFLEHIDNLGLDVDEIFKVTLVDKMTFILFMLVLHIATFSLIEYLIENEYISDLVSIMIIYSLVYLSLIVSIIFAINKLGYRVKIVLNYLNTDFNTFNIGIHFGLVFVFTGIIALLSNVIDVENIKDKDDVIGMLYRIEVITSIMFIFSSLFVLLL